MNIPLQKEAKGKRSEKLDRKWMTHFLVQKRGHGYDGILKLICSAFFSFVKKKRKRISPPSDC